LTFNKKSAVMLWMATILSWLQNLAHCCLQKERLQRPARCPDQLWHLIERCWAQDPQDRPSFADILAELQQLQQQHLEQSLQAQQQQQHVDAAGCEAVCQQQPQLATQEQQQQQVHTARPAVHTQQEQLCAGTVSTVVDADVQSAAIKHSIAAGPSAAMQLQQDCKDDDVDADVAVIF
jgi:hypothetical protein